MTPARKLTEAEILAIPGVTGDWEAMPPGPERKQAQAREHYLILCHTGCESAERFGKVWGVRDADLLPLMPPEPKPGAFAGLNAAVAAEAAAAGAAQGTLMDAPEPVEAGPRQQGRSGASSPWWGG